MAKKFISFLDTGDYQPCKFKLPNNFISTDVTFVQEALIKALCMEFTEEDTIYIYVTEVKELTPVEPEQEPTLWERIEDGFADSLEELGEKGQDFLINVTSAVPFIILWAVVIVIAYFIVRIILKIVAKKLAKSGIKMPEKITNFFAKNKAANVTPAADTKVEEVKAENTDNTSDDKTE